MCIKLEVVKSERKGGLLMLCGICDWNDEDVNCQGPTQCDGISVVILVRPYRTDAFNDSVMLGKESLTRAIERECHGLDTRLRSHQKKTG